MLETDGASVRPQWVESGHSICDGSAMRTCFVVAMISVVSGCAMRPPLMVRATGVGDTCTVRAEGLVLPSEKLNDSRVRALAEAHGGRMVLGSDSQTPYRCIGRTVFNLQRVGFHRIVSIRVNGVELPRH